MSDLLEFNPVPAYELSKALYQEKEAKQVYERMTQDEKEKTNYLMTLFRARLESSNRPYLYTDDYLKRLLLRKPLVVEDFSLTENIRLLLDYLGYNPEQVHVSNSPNKTSPTLIIKR